MRAGPQEHIIHSHGRIAEALLGGAGYAGSMFGVRCYNQLSGNPHFPPPPVPRDAALLVPPGGQEPRFLCPPHHTGLFPRGPSQLAEKNLGHFPSSTGGVAATLLITQPSRVSPDTGTVVPFQTTSSHFRFPSPSRKKEALRAKGIPPSK